MACYQLNAQVFPLKTDKETQLFTTKSGKPFFLSACSYTIVHQSPDDFNYLLNRWSNLGINTLFVKITKEDVIKDNRDPLTSFRKKVNRLKRVAGDASMNNMALIVYPENIIKNDSGSLFFATLTKKLYKYNNVLWVFDSTELDAAYAVNPSQLKAIFNTGNSSLNAKVNPDFLISLDSAKNVNSKLPSIVLCRISPQLTDSLIFNFRKALYSGFLKGSSGIILLNEQGKNFTAANPLLYQVRLFRNIIDTLHWEDLKPCPAIVNTGMSQQFSAFSAINSDSTQVLMYYFPSKILPLDLGLFKSDVTFSWIQPSTGKVFNSQVFHKPSDQLFMPPETGSSDWLLLIKPQK